MLDHTWIAAHIPHQGSMCLIDTVESWSEETICCNAVSHLDTTNPLRAENRLGSVAAIEYAAQAMAIHGALIADEEAVPGYLASVRNVTLYRSRLDNLAEKLIIQAERLSSDSTHLIYQFKVLHADDCLVEGRATVMLGMLPINSTSPSI